VSDLREQLLVLGVDMAMPGQQYYREGWINIRCPFCHSSKRMLGVSEQTYAASCWKCGKQNTLSAVLGNHPHLSRNVVKGILGDRRFTVPETEVHTGTYKPPTGLVELNEFDRKYLEQRQFDADELVHHWGIQSYSRSHRIFIPVYMDGVLVSWTSRATTKSGPRYRTATNDQSALPVGTIVYGLDKVSHTAIIVEGPTDAWAVGPGAVAVLGVSYTDAQVHRLANVPRKVICFDSSLSAQRRAYDLAGLLSTYGTDTVIVELETGSDPAEADKAEIEELRTRYLGD
jgi:hypothetical protein